MTKQRRNFDPSEGQLQERATLRGEYGVQDAVERKTGLAVQWRH